MIKISEYVCEEIKNDIITQINNDEFDNEKTIKHIKDCTKCGKSLSSMMSKFFTANGSINLISIMNLLKQTKKD